MRKAIIGWLLAAFAAAAVPSVTATAADIAKPYVTTVYNEQNGLPTGEANIVMQTSDGYIWIGSYGGLIRYDGTNFRNYSVEGLIGSSSVRSLFEDSQGRLWIGTNDAGVYMMQNDVFTKISSPDSYTFLCIRGFCEGADGTVYVASSSGMGEISGEGIVGYDIEGVTGSTVYSVAEDSLGRVWGALNNGDCAVVKDGGLVEIFASSELFDGVEIYSLDANKDGDIVLGTSGNEVAVLSFTSDGYNAEFFTTGSVVTHNQVNATDNGYILVSGLQGAAVISPDGRLTEFVGDDRAMSVNAAASDYENNLWLASSSYGIIKYSEGCFTSPNAAAGLTGVTVNTVVQQDGYYIGLDNGLIICDESWQRVTNALTEQLEGVRIRHIIADSSGRVWLASYSDNAVVCYDPQTGDITNFNTKNGLAGDRARVLEELSDGSIAVGTQTGVSIIKDGRVTASYGQADGMTNPTILCFEEGENGTLYAGSDGAGIYEITDGTVTVHGFDSGLSEGVVLRMLKNSDDSGYFVSAGSSLYYWRGGSFTKLTNFTKGAGSIFDFYDRDGKLWFLQNSGVFAVDKLHLLSGNRADVIAYGTEHGLTGSINANTWNWLTDEGELIMSTRNGISVFGFKGVEHSLPTVTVHSVSVDDVVYEHPQSITVDSSAQRITIDFSALSFANTSELRVAYRLNGFERRETVLDGEKSGSVSYTNLPGGSYTFEVWVYDTENAEERLTYTLTVNKEKLLTEEPLFWVLLTVGLIALTVGVVVLIMRLKIVRAQSRQRVYQSIVEQALMTFAKTIDAKDPYTNGHSLRVAQYSRELARRMGMNAEEQEHIFYVALMHDIGKIGVPDNILNKPDKLSDEERAIIQRHVDIGGEILQDFTALSGITDGARYHHERYDGKGYSTGLAGTDIPKVARIICVADTYDAMSSDRCYRKALSREIIEEELARCSGTQFDPEVVPFMLDMIKEGVVPSKQDK